MTIQRINVVTGEVEVIDGDAPSFRPARSEIKAWRETASIPRGAFCTNLMGAGLLPPAEAIAAARGEWPATFARALDGLSDEQAAGAQIEWAGATEIRRNAPLLARLAAFAKVSAKAVDRLCGWSEK